VGPSGSHYIIGPLQKASGPRNKEKTAMSHFWDTHHKIADRKALLSLSLGKAERRSWSRGRSRGQMVLARCGFSNYWRRRDCLHCSARDPDRSVEDIKHGRGGREVRQRKCESILEFRRIPSSKRQEAGKSRLKIVKTNRKEAAPATPCSRKVGQPDVGSIKYQ